MKNRVTGIGGLFFKSEDSKASKDWYKKHLGFNTDDWGCTFWWKDKDGNKCSTQWSPFAKDTKYFEPSKKDFMFNYRVENLVELLAELKKEGVTIVGEMETYDYGKFGWILDNEGNKVELWEPIDQVFEKIKKPKNQILMIYKESYLYNREVDKPFSFQEVAGPKEDSSSFKDVAKNVFDAAKGKFKETFTDENIEKVKQKADQYTEVAKEKAAEFSEDAKEAFDVIAEKGSELAGEAAEHLADFAEDTQQDIKEASAKVKIFLRT